MSGSICCEVCGKVLDEDKGELAHGCLDCHMDPKADKIRTLMKENAELKKGILRIRDRLRSKSVSMRAFKIFDEEIEKLKVRE